MVDIKNIPALLKTSCRFCVWKYEKRNGQKTKMPYNPANGDRAKINDLHTFADFKTALVAYAMGGYDGIGVAVGFGVVFAPPEDGFFVAEGLLSLPLEPLSSLP